MNKHLRTSVFPQEVSQSRLQNFEIPHWEYLLLVQKNFLHFLSCDGVAGPLSGCCSYLFSGRRVKTLSATSPGLSLMLSPPTACWGFFFHSALGLRFAQASLVAQLVKNLPAIQQTWVQPLGWRDPLEKGKATHCSILAWRVPWTIQSTGSQRVRHNWATFTLSYFNQIPVCSMWFWNTQTIKQI